MNKHFFSSVAAVALACATILPAFAAHGTSAGDRQFAMNAAMSGTTEVREGRAERTSNDASARTFAMTLVRDHTKGNTQLATLAQELGLTAQVRRGMAMAPMGQAMPPKEFFTHQANAHRTTIALFEREAASGESQALRAYARMSLPMLRRHLEIAERLGGM